MKTQKIIANSIVNWYRKNARDLPWRHIRDPYTIWISEIILQQTSVAQGTSYFLRFMEAFPDVQSLAEAPEDDVLKLWQGLGYYSRARNLHFTAQLIMSNYGGQFPNTYKDILSLKGIGPYTAAAVGSFAFDLNHVVVDGNVLRFMSRLLGIQKAIDTTETKKLITVQAQALLDHAKPAEFNQAIMEMGALVCTSKKPNCDSCPVATHCIAKKKNIVPVIPFKEKKIKKRHRYFHFYFVIDSIGNTLLTKRTKKDIWQGLYQFPMQELTSFDEEASISDFLGLDTYGISGVYSSDIMRQTLTHQRIHAKFHKIELQGKIKAKDYDDYILIPVDNMNKYPLPKIMDLYFNDLSITLF